MIDRRNAGWGAATLRLVLTVLATALTVILLWIGFGTRSVDSDIAPAAGSHANGDAAPHLEPVSESSDAEGLRRSVAISTPEEPQAGQSGDEQFWIRGRFLDETGAAVPEVAVSVALQATELANTTGSAHPRVTRSEARSNLDGRFTIAVAPDPRLAIEMRADTPHYASVKWKWPSVDHSGGLDVGDVVLRASGAIVGRMVDAQGRALLGQSWRIQVNQPPVGDASGREWLDLDSIVDPETGEFVCRDVPSGRTRLDADLGRTNHFSGPVVDVRPNETTQVIVRCPIEGIRDRITVRAIFRPYREHAPPELSPPILVGPGLQPRVAERKGGQFVFDGVPSGRYTITIEDPRFVPWCATDVGPGAVIEANLLGSAWFLLTVEDDETGEKVEAFDVLSEVDDDPVWGQQMHARLTASRIEPQPVRISGILPIFQTVRVRAAGYADHKLDVAPQPGETLAIQVMLSRGITLSGRVICTDGSALPPHTVVHIVPRPHLPRRLPAILAESSTARFVEIDAATGAFEVDRLSPGWYCLQASASDLSKGVACEVEIPASGELAPIELSVPLGATLSGRVVVPMSGALDGVFLQFIPLERPETGDNVSSLAWIEKSLVPIGPDGSYHAQGLPAGRVRACLRSSSFSVPDGFDGSSTTSPTASELGTIELSPGANRHDFLPGESCPGVVIVAVRVEGRPALGHVVELKQVHDRYLQTQFGVMIERDGQVRLGPVAPGDYRLVVRAHDTSWYWIAPDPVRVVGGGAVNLRCDVDLVSCLVRVREAGGSKLLTDGSLVFQVDTALPAPKILIPIDARGVTRVTLPPGRYRLGHSSSGHPRLKNSTAVDWPLPVGRVEPIDVPPSEDQVGNPSQIRR